MLAVLLELQAQQPQNVQRELVITLCAASIPEVSELDFSETPNF